MKWLPNTKGFYPTCDAKKAQEDKKAAERGPNWNCNPDPRTASLYPSMTVDEKAAELERFKTEHPEEWAMAEADRLLKEVEAKAETDRLWQARYDADNAAARRREEATRQAAEEWQEKNRQRVMGGR